MFGAQQRDIDQIAEYADSSIRQMVRTGSLAPIAGRTDEAREILRTLDTLSRERYVPPYALALVHAGLGDREAVFASLYRSYEARDFHLMLLTVDPKWDPYRADPRFAALRARCDFMRSAGPDASGP